MANYNRPRGGRVNFGGFLENTPILRTLLLVNVGIFLFELFFGKLRLSGISVDNYIAHYFNLYPLGPARQYPGDLLGPAQFYPWQLVTYMFLHDTGGIMHIAFNMLFLWMFGTQFEIIWGPKKFLTYYFLCGLGGAVAHLVISPLLGGAGPLLGASGAIFGFLVAFGLLFPDQYLLVFFFIPMKAKYAIFLFVAWEFISVGSADNIGHLAHLGGAVAGLIYLLATSGGTRLFSNFSTRRSRDNDSYLGRGPGAGSIFRRRPTDDDDAIDAEYHDISGTTTKSRASGTRVITQEDIDRILDKIAASGYQNLSEEEREILIEASRKMDQRS
jgi:membrane associated rhomboid family serine protease